MTLDTEMLVQITGVTGLDHVLYIFGTVEHCWQVINWLSHVLGEVWCPSVCKLLDMIYLLFFWVVYAHDCLSNFENVLTI